MNTTFEQYPASLEARLQELLEARVLLLQEAQSVPNDDDMTGKNPDRWSVAEIIFHLHLAEKRTTLGFRRALESPSRGALAEETTLQSEWERVRSLVGARAVKVKAPPKVFPAGTPQRADAVELIGQSRRELLATIQNISYHHLLCVSMPHPFEVIGALTGEGWLSATAFHDLRHVEQIREMKSI